MDNIVYYIIYKKNLMVFIFYVCANDTSHNANIIVLHQYYPQMDGIFYYCLEVFLLPLLLLLLKLPLLSILTTLFNKFLLKWESIKMSLYNRLFQYVKKKPTIWDSENVYFPHFMDGYCTELLVEICVFTSPEIKIQHNISMAADLKQQQTRSF